MKRLYQKIYLAAFSLCICMLTSCTATEQLDNVKRTDTAMGTIIQQNLYVEKSSNDVPEDVDREIMDLLNQLETGELSWRLETSKIWEINQDAGKAEGTKLSGELSYELQHIFQVSGDSGGALDITIGDVVKLWNIDSYASGEMQDFQLPKEEDLQKALAGTGYERVRIEPDRIYLPEGMNLDLGAVGKGLACGRVAALLAERPQIRGAVISVGGSNVIYGQKPDKSAWKIGILDPEEQGSYAGYLELEGLWYVSTSGDYERYVELDGKRYHHIIDPSTGYPADSQLRSVTILGKDGLLTDALSTACFVLGVEKGLELVQQYEQEAVCIDNTGKIYMTDGMDKYFRKK